jgi:glycosyltransferase involved in cell wall biosynthesis
MQETILFISHYAGRTGAPLMLLNLLKWLKENTRISFEILLLADGPLRQEFAALALVHVFPGAPPGPGGRAARLARRLGLAEDESGAREKLLSRLRESGIGLIYANTVVTGRALEALAPLGCPVITHIHELDYWIEQSGEENLQQVRRHTARYIAASRAVKQNLVDRYEIPPGKIDVVHSFIPARGVAANPAGIRQRLGIPEEAFVVLGSGHETWRKGKDLFVLLAAQTQKVLTDRQAHFLWVGGWQKDEDRRNILHDVRHLGLEGKVHFTGEVSNPLDYFAAGDVFAMVSREDPFPLVCLEAAALGKPVLCFADSGGMPEFVEYDAGFVVPYLDLDDMTKKLVSLADDPARSRYLGKQAAEKVRKLYDVAPGAERISRIIEDRL